MSLLRRQHWIFDMDGTLTLAIHDFDAIRAELGLPVGRTILEALAERPAEERANLHARLGAIELAVARRSEPQPGAERLLATLAAQGARLGVLTRNSQRNAFETLEAAGLAHFFAPECVLGRDQATPKPSPAGVLQLLAHWRATPASAVMVGDFLYDLVCGRAAGAATVYLDPSGTFEFAEHADFRIRTLDELLREPIADHAATSRAHRDGKRLPSA